MPADVSGLTVDDIMDDMPAGLTPVDVATTPVNLTHITTWKQEAESRAALLLGAQGISPATLSADAKIFAGQYVKAKVIGKRLVKERFFEQGRLFLDDASDLEPVLRSMAEELEQPAAAASTVQSNLGTPVKRRFGSEFDGF